MTSDRPSTKSAPGAVAAAAEGMDNTKANQTVGASVSILADPPKAVEATHTVEVVPRGTSEDGRPGWAARCSCSGVTFGGFASRRTAINACMAACEADARRAETAPGHPTWCDPTHCSPFDDTGLIHAREYVYGDDPVQARAQLGQWASLTDAGDVERPGVILEVSTPDEPMSAAEVRALADWLALVSAATLLAENTAAGTAVSQ